MTRRLFVTVVPATLAVSAWSRAQYSGPRPTQKDLPYLLEADKLIPTESIKASQSKSKDVALSVPGVTSTARTPLPEPIFLFSPGAIHPDELTLYHFVVNEGHREVAPEKKPDDNEPEGYQEDLRLALRKLDDNLYRIEATHMLVPGEYALASKSATAFCFTVY